MTAEMAVAFPALIAVLAMLLGAVTAGMTQLQLEEAARAGAREVMRGESRAAVASAVRLIAGDGARLEVSGEGRWSAVRVSAGVQGPLPGLFQWTLSATASARAEGR